LANELSLNDPQMFRGARHGRRDDDDAFIVRIAYILEYDGEATVADFLLTTMDGFNC
jgi:hypothetical protein